MSPVGLPFGGFGHHGFGHHPFHHFGHHGFGFHPFHHFGHHGFGHHLFPFFSLFPFGFHGFREEDRSGTHYAEHTVEAGDTMLKIAQKYNIPLPILLTYNRQIQNPNVINPGDKVYIPRMYDMHCQRMYMEREMQAPQTQGAMPMYP